MKIIVDTNIIFSALLSSNGTLGEIIFNSDNLFEFYSCNYMQYEIEKHWGKLKKISGLSDIALRECHSKLFSRIYFINEELIPEYIWLQAESLVQDIDIDDLDFVALAQYLNGALWTGDKVLYNGLKNKNFSPVYSTQELLQLRFN